MERKGSDRKRRLAILCAVIVVVMLCVIYRDVLFPQSSTELHQLMIEYEETGIWSAEDSSFLLKEDSAEAYFIKGMNHYVLDEKEEAERCFQEAEMKSSTDKVLPIYLNFYLNECAFSKNGIGEIAYVKRALEQIADCPILMHDTYMVFNLAFSMEGYEKEERVPARLIEWYQTMAEGLTREETLLLDTYAAILDSISEEHPECMTRFYDVLFQTVDMRQTEDVKHVQLWCMTYLADMYYMCEEYETAAVIYGEILNRPIKNLYNSAKYKYGAYVNLAGVYLETQDYGQVERTVEKAKEILPYLPEGYADEVEANLYDTLARMEIARNNLERAEKYLEKRNERWENGSGKAFFDTDTYFTLTDSELWIREGKLKLAEAALEKLLGGSAIVDAKPKYRARQLLLEIYKVTGEEGKYVRQQGVFLAEQRQRVQKYQADYCNLMRYYRDMLLLQKQQEKMIQQRGMLALLLIISCLLLGFVIRRYIMKARDSVTDVLTGLYNRKKLDREISFWEKNKIPQTCGIIMMDIDCFKMYNDTYGHLAGDVILRQVAEAVKDSVRNSDVVIRYGGEEFLVLLKQISTPTLGRIAERIRGNVEDLQIAHKMSECSEVVTLSLGGVFVEDITETTLPEAIQTADEALYTSKKNGRNTVTIV